MRLSWYIENVFSSATRENCKWHLLGTTALNQNLYLHPKRQPQTLNVLKSTQKALHQKRKMY